MVQNYPLYYLCKHKSCSLTENRATNVQGERAGPWRSRKAGATLFKIDGRLLRNQDLSICCQDSCRFDCTARLWICFRKSITINIHSALPSTLVVSVATGPCQRHSIVIGRWKELKSSPTVHSDLSAEMGRSLSSCCFVKMPSAFHCRIRGEECCFYSYKAPRAC